MAKNPAEPGLSIGRALEVFREEFDRCLDCDFDLSHSSLYRRYKVCPRCRFHYYLPAAQRIDILLDTGTFKETHRSLASLDPLSFADAIPYRERLNHAQQVTGLTEAVITGTGDISGMPVVIGAMEFGFLGGSMGNVVGEKIALAAELALKRRWPLVLAVSGGGPRMQEGVLSLMQMAKTVAAVTRLSRRGGLCLAILTSPSTGLLYAGAASLADIIFAEPGALMGFAPLKAAQQASNRPLPKGFHTAEFHREHGMVDQIVDRQELKQELALVLDLLEFKYRLTLTAGKRRRYVQALEAPAWQRVQLARHYERPTARDYIDRIISNYVELHGDRLWGDDPAIICGMGYLAGMAVMVVAHERGRGQEASHHRGGRAYPEGFRKAQRAMRLAAKFQLPLVTFIDTPGAYPGLEAEERGIGEAIASTMSVMSDLPIPIVAVILGQGGSEGALALSVADRILMMENAIYTPISPEAAAWILYHNSEKADEVAAALKLTAQDCLSLGVINELVPEPEGGAHTNLHEAARQVERRLVQALLDIQMKSGQSLRKRRWEKFRKMGTSSIYLRKRGTFAVARFLERLRKELHDRFRERDKPVEESPPAPMPHTSP